MSGLEKNKPKNTTYDWSKITVKHNMTVVSDHKEIAVDSQLDLIR
jgi:hypothetical protein